MTGVDVGDKGGLDSAGVEGVGDKLGGDVKEGCW